MSWLRFKRLHFVRQGFGGRGPRPCAFFNTPNGCKKGDFCRFAHIPAAGNGAPIGMAQNFGPGMGQGLGQGMGMPGMGMGMGGGMDTDMGMGMEMSHGGPGPDQGFGQGFDQYPGDVEEPFPAESRHR